MILPYRTAAAGVAATFCIGGQALAQAGAGEQAPAGTTELSAVDRIGTVHDNLRRARARHTPYEEALELYGDYSRLKARSQRELGLSWSMDLSYLQQWGRPDGGSPAAQVLATPGLDWVLFDSGDIGEGSVQLAYTLARYATNQDGADVQAALGLATSINGYPRRQNVFAQFTYTHAFPGNILLVSLGQYPFSNFDGNQYLNNPQQNFSNLLFAQNASETYPNAGLGAYAQVNLAGAVQFAAGFQSAANIPAANLSAKGFGDGGFAWFGYAQWTPQPGGMGASQYSITYYQVPAVPQQPRSTGWSLNAVQNLDATWAVFARANRAYDFVAPIRGSYALGGAMNNPLGRSATDQIGLAFGYADVAPPPTLPPGARDEKIIEAYWNWTIAKALLLTPDLQYVRDPALDSTRNSVWVWSLRATLMF